MDHVAKPAIQKADIRYKSTVEKIEYSTQGSGKVMVYVEGGHCYEFNEVVCTAPLGWLKRNQSAFKPPLPHRLARAIDSISYGCLEKVCIPQSLRALCN